MILYRNIVGYGDDIMEKEFKNMYLLNNVFNVVELYTDCKIKSSVFVWKKQNFVDENIVISFPDICVMDYDYAFSDNGEYAFELEVVKEYYSIMDCKCYVHFSVIENDSLLGEEYYKTYSNIDIHKIIDEIKDCLKIEGEDD